MLGHDHRQLVAIQETADLALNGGDLQTIAQGILRCAMSYATVDLGLVRFFNTATQTLEPVAHAGYEDIANITSHGRRALDTQSGRTSIRVIDAHETQVLPALRGSDRMRTLQRERVRTVVVVPIRAGAQTLGVLTLGTRTPRETSADELVVLETMGNHLGIVLQKTRMQEQLAHQALYDQLTGLANRSLLYDRLTQALEISRRDGTEIAVLFIDLDGFKAVNDSLGHAVGDQVLVAVAERLSECVRPGDTVARLGGDEFSILLGPPSGAASARTAARRVLRMLRKRLDVDEHAMVVSASVGIAVSRADDTPDTVLQNSDVAMYDAKNTGGARITAFRNCLRTGAARRLEFEGRLAAAVRSNAFHLNYQPIVNVQTLRNAGVEALLRWDDPVEGSVPPQKFVPLLEANRSLKQVGRWVLRQACRDAVTWQRPGSPLYVTVNVSAQQLRHQDFVSSVRSELDDSQLPAELLVLEVTESMLVRDADRVVKRLTELRDLGIRIAVDDFGVGYSSLDYLRMFPLDILKIDRTFIKGIPDCPRDAALLKAIVDLGAALGLEVITEGVEEPGQAQWLRTTRCPLAQGFHFARPMPADAISTAVDLAQLPVRAVVAQRGRPQDDQGIKRSCRR